MNEYMSDKKSTSSHQQESNSMSFIKGIEHIAIASPDPHRLSEWYIQRLNFSPLLDTGSTVYIRAGNSVVLEFVRAETTPPKPQIRDAGIRHIAFSVDDLELARAHLKAAGVDFEPEPVILPGARLHFFRDPESNYLHLVERKEKLPG
jgi:glyoxylase I family protein